MPLQLLALERFHDFHFFVAEDFFHQSLGKDEFFRLPAFDYRARR